MDGEGKKELGLSGLEQDKRYEYKEIKREIDIAIYKDSGKESGREFQLKFKLNSVAAASRAASASAAVA